MKLARVVVALVFSAFLFQANTQSKPQNAFKTVTAGDLITFDVELNQIPQFSGGRVAVLVCPINANLPDEAAPNGVFFSRASSTETISNQKKYVVTVQIPGDAPDGVWQAFFSFALPNGSYTELRHARTIFQVRRQEYSGVPLRAEISMQ
jgi:hypothetical protein